MAGLSVVLGIIPAVEPVTTIDALSGRCGNDTATAFNTPTRSTSTASTKSIGSGSPIAIGRIPARDCVRRGGAHSTSTACDRRNLVLEIACGVVHSVLESDGVLGTAAHGALRVFELLPSDRAVALRLAVPAFVVGEQAR